MFRHSAFPLEPGSRTNAVLSMVDLIACTSLEQKREQFPVDSLKVDSDSVFVLTSSVSAETMAAIRAETKSGARARLGLPAEKMLFLSLNRLSWEKGVDRTIRALAAIDAELRELSHLVIVGGGPDEDALRALLNWSSRIVSPSQERWKIPRVRSLQLMLSCSHQPYLRLVHWLSKRPWLLGCR